MNLNQRHERFLIEAYKSASNKGDKFDVRSVGQSGGFSAEESDDIARELANTQPPEIVRLPNHQACLARGRETARLCIEQAKERRKRRFWTAAKYFWGIFVSALSIIVIPLWISHLDRRIQRWEQERRDPSPATATQMTRASSNEP